MIRLDLEERFSYTIVNIELDGNIEPADLAGLEVPQVYTKGVVLSGRAPIWLFCHLTHAYHPTTWVATYDPRLGGAVVVESHTKNVRVGQVIPISETEDK